MKPIILLLSFCLGISYFPHAQVTQLNSNKSLHVQFPLGNNKAILVSAIDSTLWVTDGTTFGTFQLSGNVFYEEGGVLNNKLIFAATSAATGSELWITDGTIAGTSLLKDINPGPTGSFPDDDFAQLNGYLYFTAISPGIGRELWRTDGTSGGTTLVKDIIAGPAQSNLRGAYNIFSTGNYLLLSIPTSAEGVELWRSDGTSAGTQLLKDINPGFPGSGADNYQLYNSTVFFTANDGVHGVELWKTDGTLPGTTLVKDIRPGSLSGVNYLFLYPFNGKAYFIADNGVTGGEIWSTDGTETGTSLLKDIEAGIGGSFVSLFSAIKTGNKFFFSAYSSNYGFELWESDGTTTGTKLFKEMVDGVESAVPFILPSFSFTGNNLLQSLYQGNKFFFLVRRDNIGVELWVSDGTLTGTVKVKTINNFSGDIDHLSYLYTTSSLYFTADGGAYGNELWKTDGTETGTQQVADVNPGTGSSEIQLSFIINNKLLFEANNGDNASQTDIYRLDADLISLPIKLGDFTVRRQAEDALLNWFTVQEENSKNFIVERSFDGVRFSAIGTVNAAGYSVTTKAYSFLDQTISGRNEDAVYYRLLLQDQDGKKTNSPVKTLKLKVQSEWVLQLKGNPVQNEIRITIKGNMQPVGILIKDGWGRTVKSIAVTSANETMAIPINELPNGTYFLTAQSGTGVKAIKFVKQ